MRVATGASALQRVADMSIRGAGIQFGSPQIPMKRARSAFRFTCMLLRWALSLGVLIHLIAMAGDGEQLPLVPSLRRQTPPPLVRSLSDSDSSSYATLRQFAHSSGTLQTYGGDDEPDDHPVYNPERVICSFCRSRGHSLMNCFERMKLHRLRMETHCKHGWHKPHLHDRLDLWRCEWCLMHLKTSYVKRWYPDAFDSERKKTAAQLARNLARYSDTDSSKSTVSYRGWAQTRE